VLYLYSYGCMRRLGPKCPVWLMLIAVPSLSIAPAIISFTVSDQRGPELYRR